MKTKYTLLIAICLLGFTSLKAQDNEVQTVFRGHNVSHGGYGAITNKFTSINGEFANMVGLYGGWFINKKLMLGFGAAATTSFLPVPEQFSQYPGRDVSYEYGQVGFMTEYVVASNKSLHVTFNLLTGSGFTTQYIRYPWDEYDYYNYNHSDSNWFFVVEPGVQVEVNLLKWMRFSPGVSYRFVNNSKSPGLSDSALSGASVDLTLKFGKF